MTLGGMTRFTRSYCDPFVRRRTTKSNHISINFLFPFPSQFREPVQRRGRHRRRGPAGPVRRQHALRRRWRRERGRERRPGAHRDAQQERQPQEGHEQRRRRRHGHLRRRHPVSTLALLLGRGTGCFIKRTTRLQAWFGTCRGQLIYWVKGSVHVLF